MKRRSLYDLVSARPKTWIALFVAIALATGAQLFRVQIDADLKSYLPPDLDVVHDLRRVEKLFGSSDVLLITVSAPDVLEPAVLERVGALSKRLKRAPDVSSVLSLTEARSIRGEDGSMIVEPLVRRIPRTPAEREALRRLVAADEFMVGTAVSRDFRHAAILLSLRGKADDDVLLRAVDEAIAAVPGPGEISMAGTPLLRSSIVRDIAGDLLVLVPVGVALMLGFLWFATRQLRGVALPVGMVLLATLFCFGLLPVLGWKLNLLSMVLAVLMLAIANNYAIYFVVRYQELNVPGSPLTVPDLVRASCAGLAQPVVVAGVTTMAGLASLVVHVIVPAQQMGWLSFAAVGFALLASLFVAPAVLLLLPRARPAHAIEDDARRERWLDHALVGTARLVARHPKALVGASVAALAVLSSGAWRIHVNSNLVAFFAPDHPVRQAYRRVNSQFGGVETLSVVATGDIRDPAVLRELEAMEQELAGHRVVGSTASIAKVVRRMNRALQGDEAGDRIPPTRDEVAQQFLLYSMNGDSADFERLVDFPYENAQVLAQVNVNDTAEFARLEDAVRARIAAAGAASAFKTVTGTTVLYRRLAKELVEGQVWSLVLSLLLVMGIVAAVFRSLVAGLMAGLPLGTALALLFGVMGYAGLELNMVTGMISCIMVGLGVDYAVHFLWRCRDERRAGLTPPDAVFRTLANTGRGIIFNAVSVMLGFTPLLLSAFVPARLFAFLMLVCIGVCMFGALVLVPAMTLVFRPRFLEPAAARAAEAASLPMAAGGQP